MNEDNFITQNLLSGNEIAIGPHWDGDLIDTIITQNQIVENTFGLGGGSEGLSWINTSITDNLIADNFGVALSFTSYKAHIDRITIDSNEIRNNGRGIYLSFSCPETIVINNIISDNNGVGLNLDCSVSDGVISGNRIEGNLGGLRLSQVREMKPLHPITQSVKT